MRVKPFPLLMKFLLERSFKLFPKQDIVDRDFRYTYHDAYERMCKLANAIEDLKVEIGDKVATLAWNTHRHFELYWTVPCMGSVLHPVNMRLLQDQIVRVINHAEDKVIFLDSDFIPLVEGLGEKLETVRAYVILTDKSGMPGTQLEPVYEYEMLLKKASSTFEWPEFDENALATLGYTTGTTGEPKGAYFTHRMLFLHTLITTLPEAFSITRNDTVLHVVPMFHAHSWGLPYDSTLVGAKQVFPGKFDPKTAMELIQRERVTIIAAVPTLYAMMLEHPEVDKYDLSSLKYAFSGGAPTSIGLIKAFREKFGVQLITSYGLTETCPVLTKAHLKPYMRDLSTQRQDEVYSKTGLPLPGLDLKIINERGEEVSHDGKTIGEIVVRGPYVTPSYYKDPERTAESWDERGYFHTGDAAVIDAEGYITIVDRYKDIIRSGGEIIPSTLIDKVIEQHPAVTCCATIAMPHEKWGERPLACVVLAPEFKDKVTDEEIRKFCEDKMPKWQIPDAVLFLDSMPMTSAGKKDKKLLRAEKVWERVTTKLRGQRNS
jgi:fatty-acyl-CoA synthase